MNAPKRRGRPRKVRNSSASKESNDCEWTALGHGLKIILKKVDARKSALVPFQREVSTNGQKFLSPTLTLPRVDSITQHICVSAIDNGSQSHVEYSKSIVHRPDQSVFTERIFASNTFVDYNSSVRRRSRRILKDLKNTSSNGETRKNTTQPNLDGQENVPVSYSAHPQVCVRLTQLNESTVDSLQNRIRSRLQSFSEGPGCSPEVILKRFIQTNEMAPVQLNAVPSLGAAPAKRGRKRKSREKAARESRNESKEKIACRRSPRSSSIVTRQTTGNDLQFAGTSSQEKQSEIPQNTVERRVNDDGSTQIIREKAAVQFCNSSFENQENDISNFPKSPSGLQESEIRVDISMEVRYSSVEDETVEKSEQSFSFIGKRKWRDSSESGECSKPRKRPFGKCNNQVQPSYNEMNKCVVSIERFEKIQQSSKALCPVQQSDRFGSGKLFSGEINSKPSSSYVTRNKASKSDESVTFYQIPWKKSRGIEELNEKPAESDELSQNEGFVGFPRLHENKEKTLEKLNEKPDKSDVKSSKNENSKYPKLRWKTLKKIERLNEKSDKSDVESSKPEKSVQYPGLHRRTVKKLEKLNGKAAESDVKENCCPVKPKVKRKYEKKSKTNPVGLYSCYRTRQKTAQNDDSFEFYQMPWKATRGFEVVQKKSKMDIKTDTDVEEPAFKGWSTENVNVALPAILRDAETSISKKGILKHNGLLASSTPFIKSSRRNANVSFASDDDRMVVDPLSPVSSEQITSTPYLFNGFALRPCTVLLTCLPNPVPKSPDKGRKRMTLREARQKAESINKSKKAFEDKAKSDRSNCNASSKKSRPAVKRNGRLANKQKNNRCPTETSSSSEEEQEILVNRNKPRTPYVQLRRLNPADITSYKITPLKEDRIPKRSKTVDDYGIDDINTDDSTDDEEYPKKCIPEWAKNYQNLPRCQSYVKPGLIDDWMQPPKFSCSLRYAFFSVNSHNFM